MNDNLTYHKGTKENRPVHITLSGSVADQMHPRHKSLPMAGRDGLLIAHMFGTQAVNANDVTSADLQAYLPSAIILFLSIHGQIEAAHGFHPYILFS